MASEPAILAIDTTAAQCAVAFVCGTRQVSRVRAVRRGHAELLFPMIDEALAAAGAGYGDLDRIVSCTGPGSFAGTRIGVAAARGLALGTGLPAVGVTRFEALAADAGPGRVAVLIAARGDRAWIQVFEDGVAVDEPRTVDALDREVDRVAGDGLPGLAVPRVLAHGLPDPAILARLGLDRDPTPPAPLYLRPPDADPPREGPPRILA